MRKEEKGGDQCRRLCLATAVANSSGPPPSDPIILYLIVLLQNNEEENAEGWVASLADVYWSDIYYPHHSSINVSIPL